MEESAHGELPGISAIVVADESGGPLSAEALWPNIFTEAEARSGTFLPSFYGDIE